MIAEFDSVHSNLAHREWYMWEGYVLALSLDLLNLNPNESNLVQARSGEPSNPRDLGGGCDTTDVRRTTEPGSIAATSA
jgi:hypothetical protein